MSVWPHSHWENVSVESISHCQSSWKKFFPLTLTLYCLSVQDIFLHYIFFASHSKDMTVPAPVVCRENWKASKGCWSSGNQQQRLTFCMWDECITQKFQISANYSTDFFIFFPSVMADWPWAGPKLPNLFPKQAWVTQAGTGPASTQLQVCEVCALPIRSGLLPGNVPGIRQLMTIKYLSYCQSIKQWLTDDFYSRAQHCRLFGNEWGSFLSTSRNGASQSSVFLFIKSPIHLHEAAKPWEGICHASCRLEREAHHAGKPPSLLR